MPFCEEVHVELEGGRDQKMSESLGIEIDDAYHMKSRDVQKSKQTPHILSIRICSIETKGYFQSDFISPLNRTKSQGC